MRLKEYLKKRKKTDRDLGDQENILHMVMGLITEVDELINCKAYEVTDETGDLCWYLYKPLSMNKEIFSTTTRFNKILDVDIQYDIQEIKMKCLDSYKKIRFQQHDINTMRKDGHTHLEMFKMLMHFCLNLINKNIRTYGLTDQHIYINNINKLSNRYKGGTFNKNLSMKRSDKNE